MTSTVSKKREYRQAEEQFAKAYAVDKSANALAAQAWSIYMDPTRKAEAGKENHDGKENVVRDEFVAREQGGQDDGP